MHTAEATPWTPELRLQWLDGVEFGEAAHYSGNKIITVAHPDAEISIRIRAGKGNHTGWTVEQAQETYHEPTEWRPNGWTSSVWRTVDDYQGLPLPAARAIAARLIKAAPAPTITRTDYNTNGTPLVRESLLPPMPKCVALNAADTLCPEWVAARLIADGLVRRDAAAGTYGELRNKDIELSGIGDTTAALRSTRRKVIPEWVTVTDAPQESDTMAKRKSATATATIEAEPIIETVPEPKARKSKSTPIDINDGTGETVDQLIALPSVEPESTGETAAQMLGEPGTEDDFAALFAAERAADNAQAEAAAAELEAMSPEERDAVVPMIDWGLTSNDVDPDADADDPLANAEVIYVNGATPHATEIIAPDDAPDDSGAERSLSDADLRPGESPDTEPCDECSGTRYPADQHDPHCSLYVAPTCILTPDNIIVSEDDCGPAPAFETELDKLHLSTLHLAALIADANNREAAQQLMTNLRTALESVKSTMPKRARLHSDAERSTTYVRLAPSGAKTVSINGEVIASMGQATRKLAAEYPDAQACRAYVIRIENGRTANAREFIKRDIAAGRIPAGVVSFSDES